MSEILEAVRYRLEGYPAGDCLVDALDGRRDYTLMSKTLIPPQWSELFNAYSEACAHLNFMPGEKLTDKPMDVPLETEWLGGALLRLVNGSIGINTPASYSFESRGSSQKRVCQEAEGKYVESLGNRNQMGFTSGQRKNIVYLDDKLKPVFFRKGRGVGSSLSLRPVSINCVSHPEGTIMDVRIKKDSGLPLLETPYTDIRYINDIGAVYPLRLSMMAVPRAERVDARLTTIKKRLLPGWELKRIEKEQTALPAMREIQSYVEIQVDSLFSHFHRPLF